jgi:hypothetical protein
VGAIQNITSINLSDIINMSNASGLPELAINVNHQAYGGLFFYLMLWTLSIILYFTLSQTPALEHKYLAKALISFTIVSLIALPLRLISINDLALINDFQLWSFIIITLILSVTMWATHE